MNDVSVYVHLPFCQRKCRYCDFVSFTDKYGKTHDYCNRVLNELRQYNLSEYRIRSVFFGGGTPSSVNEYDIEEILNGIGKQSSLADNCEITVECNPSSLQREKLMYYKSFGINRVSIGVQSFDDKVLNVLGRLHNAAQAKEKVGLAVETGFKSVSLDLMLAVPEQTEKSLDLSIKTAISLGVNHISLYSLIVEDGTPLKGMIEDGTLCRTDDEEDRRMYSSSVDLLGANGFERYEISNFAREGFESVHNTAYWERKEYIGLGVAAHSFFKNRRYCNTTDFEEYLAGTDVAEQTKHGEETDSMSAAEETVMLGLRMKKGFSKSTFAECAGFDINERCAKSIKKYCEMGLLEDKKDSICLTDKGFDFADRITLDIITEF